MFYEESFFQRWARRKAQQRERPVQCELERESPAKQTTASTPPEPTPVRTTRKDIERETETV